jgi:hypothetical protein
MSKRTKRRLEPRFLEVFTVICASHPGDMNVGDMFTISGVYKKRRKKSKAT